MGQYMRSSKDQTSWREIVLGHIQKILECSRTEFRGGFYIFQGNNPPIKTYIPDTREAYLNGVLALSDVLIPFYDETMKKKHKEIIEKYDNVLDYIIKQKREKLIKDYKEEKKQWKKEPELYPKPSNAELKKNIAEYNYYHITKEKKLLGKTKVIIIRELFQELNLLLRRVDYLKGSIYSEGDIEEAEEYAEGEEE